MHQSFALSSLVPPGFVVETIINEGDKTLVTAHCSSDFSLCPACGTASRSVHSRYRRCIADLPLSGKMVQLLIVARRFRCRAALCATRIFTERFANGVVSRFARRSGRLECLVHYLGLALGGRPAATFAKRLMLPVSNDTLLRVVRRRARAPSGPLNVIGIDDWAWRKNQRYGTIVCDLEQRKVVTLLPDREQATAQTWLAGHPEISIVARDRGGGYGEAVAKGLPNAVQVADRWHLMENASHAFLGSVRKSMHDIRKAIGAAIINPALLTRAEKLQYDGYLRREETNSVVMALSNGHVPIMEIVRRTGLSRGTVRQIVRGRRGDVFRSRESSLDNYLPTLDTLWIAGCHNGAKIWRHLKTTGFRGSLRVVAEWATRRRRSEVANTQQLSRVPSARTLARLMTTGRDTLSKSETVTIAAIEGGIPALVESREVIALFHAMIKSKAPAGLTDWLERAQKSLVASFANGVTQDEAAVREAMASKWSNGQTEGQITRLKLVKRQMYGRGHIDLLQARLVGAG